MRRVTGSSKPYLSRAAPTDCLLPAIWDCVKCHLEKFNTGFRSGLGLTVHGNLVDFLSWISWTPMTNVARSRSRLL
jgi:hypothetical protein